MKDQCWCPQPRQVRAVDRSHRLAEFTFTMPVAASSQQKDPQVPARFRHLLPKPPNFPHPGGANHGQLSPSQGLGVHPHPQDSASYVAETAGQLAANIAVSSTVTDNQSQYFSTHSPPILNLSPNLSPTDGSQRASPGYDLRDTTRRRSVQDLHSGQGQPLQHSSQYYSGFITTDESGRKSESPTRKRRKMSHGIIDLTHTQSPSPPPARPWDNSGEWERQQVRRRSTTQRRVSSERCNTPRQRRSPATRRRTRDRHMLRPSESPERRAFQPPAMAARQLHPAVLPHNTHPHMTSHHHMTSHPIVIDVEQGPVSNPVTVTPYGIPVCSGPHHIPICTGAHVPMCSTQPTWSIPACSMPIPSCSIQHLPTCSLQSIPVPHATMAPIMNSHPHPTHHSHMTHHVAQPSQFVPTPPPVQHQDEDVQIIGEHRAAVPRHYLNPAVAHQHHHAHHPPSLTPSPPVLLQEPAVHPTPHELYNPFSRYRRTSASRNRWRSIPPPPPPYPGFLLHFLAMLGNPPMPHYGMDLSEDATEVENYERHLLSSPHQALLNLAERLGEAKPRGLSKGDIDQLPHYRYNADINRSHIDQTSCVVCMCDFENRQILRILPCSHEFHAKCVDKWLKTNRTCPICRADASGGLSQSE